MFANRLGTLYRVEYRESKARRGSAVGSPGSSSPSKMSGLSATSDN